MSRHAQLNPEAQARLAAEHRKSTLLSMLVAALFLVLCALVLAFFVLPAINQETPVIVSYADTSREDQQLEAKKVTRSEQMKPSAPSAAMSRVIAANTSSPTAIPVPEIDLAEPSLEFGSGNDFGSGWGAGDSGMGGGFDAIPATMRKRCSKEDRLQRLSENGGTESCEDAVERGLAWLKSTQNADGSWDRRNQPAMTGLALLAFLGRCETPASTEYGKTVLEGITWLVNLGLERDGRLFTSADHIHQPYEHAIATYAMGEAATFCRQLGINVPNLDQVTQQACQFLIDRQHEDTGAWEYGFQREGGRGGDLSVSAWCIQALKACHHSGLEFDGMDRCVRDALDYVDGQQNRDGAFEYDPDTPTTDRTGYFTLTGAGMLCFQMWDKGNTSSVRQGARYIRRNSAFDFATPHHESDLYAHYYESQAMIARGGPDWDFYNRMFRDELLANQNDNGSFKPTAEENHHLDRTHYRSCLGILMLETYYRFLPSTGTGI